MRATHEEYDSNINKLIIRDIKIYDENSVTSLKEIIKKLVRGRKFYFEFVREDFFLEEHELVKYRKEVPQYFKESKDYEVKFKIDETHFRSIGCLDITEETYNQVISFWKYFETLVFFNPTSTLEWERFDKAFNRKKAEVQTIDLLENEYADSVFIKGHDGDNLIFMYNNKFDKSLILNIIKTINIDN